MDQRMNDTPTHFPVARYRLEWQVTDPIRLPAYAGSMLRGAFGHALRHLACMTKQKDCGGCPLHNTCPYPKIFSPPAPASHSLQKFSSIPVPYVIEPMNWGERTLHPGETTHFHLVLIGQALNELPLIVLAWRRALLRGLGKSEGKAELLRVVHCGEHAEQSIYHPAQNSIAQHLQKISLSATCDTAQNIRLRFATPLRLQQNGHALPPDKLDARTFLIALVRRANLLAEFHAGSALVNDFAPLVAASTQLQETKNLRWLDWTRYSSRQQQSMALGGVVGEWQISGNLAPFLPFLHLGQWLHVGKEASFGLGHYLAKTGPEDISTQTMQNTENALCKPLKAKEKEEVRSF